MKKRNKNNAKVIDMSSRKNMNVICNKEYTEEELNMLILELKKQMEQKENIHKQYYSLNAYIDRIKERTFSNILQAKLYFIISKFSFFLHPQNRKIE